MIQAIVLDFDGVILESVQVKTEAFRELFSFRPECVGEIVDFHIKNGGMSRYDKFRYIYANILDEPLTEEQFDSLCRKFSELVYDGIIKSSFVNGALKFLEDYHEDCPLYIVSATPGDELLRITVERGIDRYFTKIYGAPKKKADCICEIVSSGKYRPESVVFVGDAINDWKAAGDAGVRFIGRVKPGGYNPFTGRSGVETTVEDFDELGAYIKREAAL